MINFYSYHNDKLDLDEYKEYLDLLVGYSRYTYGMLNWSTVEHIIRRSPMLAYRHALSYKRGRWPEAEPIIMKNAYYACMYAVYVIHGRWPEAEPDIMKDEIWCEPYREKFNI